MTLFNYATLLLATFILQCSKAPAQEQLSISKAIEIALHNNYGILISKNEAQITKNDNSLGNAGFMPQVNITAGSSYSNNNTNQKYSNGQEVNKNNVESNNLNAGAALSWTLFDGLKMFATRDKLKLLEDQGELDVKITIENTLETLLLSYYDVVRIKQLIKEDHMALTLYDEREKITQLRFDIGSGPKSDLLQTKIDKNKLTSTLIGNQQNLDVSKSNLNQVLGRPAETPFDVSDSMVVRNTYKKETLTNSIYEQNFVLQKTENNLSVLRNSIREYESQRFPKLGITGGYNFLKTENKAGFALYNQTSGINFGFTASWNLFNGFNTGRQVKNARLNWLNAKEEVNFTKSAIDIALYKAWKTFENANALLKLEEENILLAKENAGIALQRFKTGASGILELKEAQRSLEESSTRVISARFAACIAEVSLMKLNGELLK